MSRRKRRERHNRRKRNGRPRGLQTRHSLITGATVTAGALVGFSSTAAAADFQVDNLSDNPAQTGCTGAANDCSLRGAVTDANASAAPYDNITFQSGLSGQISLTNGEIPVTGATYFVGPGTNVLRISGGSSSRIFNINLSPGHEGEAVGIYDLSLMYGYVAGDGGAVINDDAQLKIVRSILSKNSATGKGGAVYETGAFNSGYSDYIVDSTFSLNTATGNGGGLYGFTLGTIENSTISGNRSNAGSGGGVGTFSDTIINDSTIAGNAAASGAAGGVFIANNGRYDDFANTLVADNTASFSPDVYGRFASSFSLIENPGSAIVNSTVAGSNVTGVDPQLNGLSDNGGPTPTQLPAVTSPAIDQGKRAGPGRDQRGQPRPFDVPTIPNSAAAGADGSDIGAVELQAGELPSNAFALGRVKGKTLPVNVSVPGSVSVVDAATPLLAEAAKKRKLLKPSSASGGPPTILVKLLLTKLGKQKLRQKGKVTVNARVTFTPNRGIPKTITQKLKIKRKKKK